MHDLTTVISVAVALIATFALGYGLGSERARREVGRR